MPSPSPLAAAVPAVPVRRVAIVGAGFSGTLLAVNLLRRDGPRVVLIERDREPGLGLAYGAADPSHLLNVRAGGMSAFPDDAGHFVRWLAAHGRPEGERDFIPRVVFGEYVRDLLAEAQAMAGDRLEIVRGDVVDATVATGGVVLHLADGGTIAADAAVLAVGNLPPQDPPGMSVATLSPDRYRADPWQPGATAGLGPDDTVLAIGTGLTMIDMALMLNARGFGGQVVALSRRGLLPRRHAPMPTTPRGLPVPPPTRASHLLRDVRVRARTLGWREAVDELRPFTQSLWAAATKDERARFLRHLRPWWDVHRHRLAPAVADRLDTMVASGRLEIAAGKLLDVVERPDGVAVTWRPRGEDGERKLVAQRILNCTGPQGNLARVDEPLLAALYDRGLILPDAARLGIDVDAGAATIAADGGANERLFAVGPMTKGAFWEIVAVPDIRGQVAALAHRLADID